MGRLWADRIICRAHEVDEFIDKDSSRDENGFMYPFTTSMALCVAVFLAGVALAVSSIIASTTFAASLLFWCPDQKADRQYSAKQEPGCVPLAEKEETGTTEQPGETLTGDKPLRDFKIENLQSDISTFLNK